jgi:hypothetical protein
MATLLLDQVWLNRLDTGEALHAYSARGRVRARRVAGEVRQMAGGRQRSFSQVGISGTHAFVLRMVSMAQIDTLEAWMAPVVVQYRDHRGQLFNGVYREVAPVEYVVPYWWDVPITLELVTVDG